MPDMVEAEVVEDEDVPVARRRDGPSGWSARGGKKCVEMASHVRVDRDGVLHESSVSVRSSGAER